MKEHQVANSTTVAVTGATGYIGQAVVARLVGIGCAVVALSRKATSSNVTWRSYDLARPLERADLDGVDAIIHLAAETHRGPLADAGLEVAAVGRLLEACRARKARLIFVSSQTAREDAATEYGRSKWRCEQAVLAEGGIVVRPGQVYGGPGMGLFGTVLG